MCDTMTNRERHIYSRDDLAYKVSLAPLPDGMRLPHGDPRAETAPAPGVITPARRLRRRTPVLVVALRELLAEERQ